MHKYLWRIALAGVLAVTLVGCGKKDVDEIPAVLESITPALAVEQSAALVRANDLGGLFAHMLPPAELEQVKAHWRDGQEMPDAEQREQFAQMMAQLNSPQAEELLWQQIEPQLRRYDEQYRAQLPVFVEMGRGWLRAMLAESEDATEAEKRHAMEVVDALAEWLRNTPFGDRELMRETIGIIVATARDLDLHDLEQVRALEFDESMDKASQVFAASKQVLALYGLSIDRMLDSVQATTVSEDGDHAVVRVDYRLLDVPLTHEMAMERIDGRWYSVDRFGDDALDVPGDDDVVVMDEDGA